jgi:hypothetical protein
LVCRHGRSGRLDFGGMSMEFPKTELSMEQKFQLQVYERQMKHLSLHQAQEFLLEVTRQLMIKENVIKDLMKRG